MTTPPLLLLAALVFWGWQNGLLAWGLALGALLELSRGVPTRWDLQPEDFRRLWNVTILLFLGAGLYLFFAEDGWGTMGNLLRDPTLGAQTESYRTATRAALRFIQWLPLLFFPFVLAHTYSRAGRLPWSTISPYLHRRQRHVAKPAAHIAAFRGFHPLHPYLLVVLFAASATDRHPLLYLPFTAVLVAWILWPQRTRRFGRPAWAGALAVSLGLAYAGQQGLLWVFHRYEQLETRWLNQLSGSRFDAQGAMTDIGAIGRRKLSGRILLRVRGEGSPPPALLREAVYHQYRAPYWAATGRTFQPVLPQPDQESWRLRRAPGPRQVVTISRYSIQGETPVALPDAAIEIRTLPAESVETNRFTTARARGVPKLVSYSVHYQPSDDGFDSPPGPEDLDLALLGTEDAAAIRRAAGELGLPLLDARAAVDRVRQFFFANFEYSLEGQSRARATADTSPLAAFLFTDRRGHCEYFATATALLLRAAGVPTRYVVGYSVQERKGEEFIVRSRHAHAWCLAFADGRWETADHTPAVWSEQDNRLASLWEPVGDLLADGWHLFSRWRQGESPWRVYVFLIGLAVLGFMAWRELRGGRWRRARSATAIRDRVRFPAPGLDSEFYILEVVLARRYAPRGAGEPLAAWIRRLGLPTGEATGQLDRLIRLHYRLRFDPAGLSAAEREELRAGAGRCRSGFSRDSDRRATGSATVRGGD